MSSRNFPSSRHTNRFNRQYSTNSLLCSCWWLFKTLVETLFTYLEVAVLIMWVQSFAQIKVQKSGLCHEYKVRNLIENGLHVNSINIICVTREFLIGVSSVLQVTYST